jgi:O-antigen ligase
MTERALVAATTALLLVAPFAGSAGTRGALLLIAAGALVLQWRGSRDALRARIPRELWLTLAAWSAWSLASLGWSVDAGYSLGEVKAELLYGIAALLVFAASATPRWAPAWLASLAAGTVLACLGAVLQPWFPAWLSRHPIDGGPGYLSTHVVLAAPALVAAALLIRTRGFRVAACAAATAGLVLVAWHSGNRIVWLALAAEIACGLAAWSIVARRRGGTASRAIVPALLAGALVCAAFAGSVVEREERVAASPIHEGHIEADLRPRIWHAALERAREAPWIGHGFGREIVAGDFIPLTPRDTPELRHAHNLFIDIVLQLGLVGLALFAALLLALVRAYAAMLRDPQRYVLGIVGIATLAGFVTKNMTDDFFHRHNALVFWIVQGALLGLASRERALR